MFYKPKYCCECGEEIGNPDRNLFSSGRFCDVCKTVFQPQTITKYLGFCAAILFGLFGVGKALMPDEQPVNLTAKQLAESAPVQKKTISENKNAPSAGLNIQPSVNSNNRISAENQPPTKPNINEQREKPTSETKVFDNEPTYFCGAATKKGSACSRRIKGGGRCWQHVGQSAVLSPEKLLVSR